MAAPKGNQFWKVRTKHGRDAIFSSPDVMWEAACEYFEWVEDNPLLSSELVKFQGQAKEATLPKMRAMTIDGLCLFMDIARRTWDEYVKREDFMPVTSRIENVIRSQKFAGAAADLLNANIIARDLGLADKNELSGANGGPIETVTKIERTIVRPNPKHSDG